MQSIFEKPNFGTDFIAQARMEEALRFVRENVSFYLDGKLNHFEKKKFDSYLKDYPACVKLYQKNKTKRDLLENLIPSKDLSLTDAQALSFELKELFENFRQKEKNSYQDNFWKKVTSLFNSLQE